MLHAEHIHGGPQVAIEPDGTSPVAAVYLWFRVGSAMEPAGLEGGAHFLEHMLFKGAGEHGVGEAATRIEGMGGELNAFTTYEQTVLHATVPAGRAPDALAVLAEMATRPHLDPTELARERDVVVEEIRGAADASDQLLADGLRAAVYGAHPYGRPILGTEASVRGLSREALLEFHRQYYHGANAVLAVAGPVEVAPLLAEVRRSLSGAGPTAAPPLPVASLTPGGQRFFCIDQGFEERLVEVAFPAPDLAHEDQAALDLLITALGSGESGALARALKLDEELASDTWAALEPEPRGSMMVFGAAAREGKVSRLATALGAVLARVAREGVSTADLHRARETILTARIHDRETVDGRAHRLAWYQAHFGDPARELAYEAALLRVSPRTLREVAERWLRPDRLCAGAVAPHRQLGAGALERALRSGLDRPAPARPSSDFQRVILDNGARLILRPDAEAELASLSVVGVGGSLVEGRPNAGLADIWAATAARGAGDLDGPELAEAIDERGGSVNPWAWRNSSGVTATFPGGELRAGLGLLLDVLTAPRFDADEVDRARTELDEARESAEDSPEELAWDLAWQGLFRGHPWGRPAQGTPAGTRRATPSRLRAYHRRIFCGNNLVIAVTGAFDPDRVIRAMRRGLGSMPAGAPVPQAPPEVPEVLQRRRKVKVERQQARLVLAFPSAGWGQPDAPALRLLEATLGGQGGRLFSELRERRGLAYDVQASAEEGLGGGAFLCALGTDPERTREAWAALWGTLEALREAPPSPAELERNKARVVQGAALDLQRCSERAAHLASAERYGPGAEHADALSRAPAAVSAEALQDLARRLLQRDRCVEVQVGPAP